MCPVFRALGLEEASPRAKVNLLREIERGELDFEKGVREIVNLCLGCRSCGEECPSGLSVPELILLLRSKLWRQEGPGIRDRFLSFLPELFRLGRLIRPLFNFFGRSKALRKSLSQAFGLTAEAPFPSLARERFIPPKEKGEAAGQGKEKVVFFVDLWADLIEPDLGKEAWKLLFQTGAQVAFPEQEPCGIVPLTLGNFSHFERIARRNFERLKPWVDRGYVIVTPEPSAALALEKDYPLALGEGFGEEKVWELGQYLYQRWQAGSFRPALGQDPGKVCYHRPCHLRRDRSGFRDLLREALGLEIADLPNQCCGLAGSFGYKKEFGPLSTEIGQALVEAIHRGGYEVVLSECSSCRLQLERLSGVKTLHPLTLLV